MTKELLKNNPHLLITVTDKGNITIAISRNQYNIKMLDILNDRDGFEIIQNDPKIGLQNGTLRILEGRRAGGLLGKNIKKSETDTINTNLSLSCGLVKAHKMDFTLRPVI